ncbi:MAG TPA: zinc-dependent metalloprotease [Aeromicrobium sp.]|nr:zinc-dependent metalloprotease [Aeromicrobium sp.]
MIDWDFALKTAERMVPPGPRLSAAEVDEVVTDLRAAAAEAEAPVRTFTGLKPERQAVSPVLVVDRPHWVEANLSSARVLLEPVVTKLQKSNRAPTGLAKSVGESINGMEIGALLSFMSTKVLGQFDPFGSEPGRLLLVAPNIVHVERQLEVVPHDFRRWVCLHEETHRVQFTAVPWLSDHLRSLIAEFTDATDLDAAALGRLLTSGIVEIIRIIRGTSDASLMDVLQNDAQRAVIDKLTGVMSLLEGHADVVMDGVGPEVIPTVVEIRRAFERRRASIGGLDRVMRRLLGLEAKMRQYRDGAVFVRAVSDKVGHDGFNAVWSSAENLPSRSEIVDPESWVTRVHG